MSEKPHTVAIGAFVIGALLIAVTAIIFALGTGIGQERSTVVMVFDGSVKGLSVGAPVALRGVQIGQVTDVELVLDSDTVELIMLVEAEISGENIRRSGSNAENLTEELISRGLRAQLNTQSLLTGLLYVQLDFHPDSAINLAEIDSPYLQIPTIPTELERITRRLESIDFAKVATDMESIAEGINRFINSEGFQQLPQQVRATLASVDQLSAQLQGQIASTGPKLDSVLEEAATTVSLANAELPQLAKLINDNLDLLEDAIKAFEQGMLEFEGLVDYDSATVYELNRALRELGQAGRALQQLGQTLEEQPEAIIRGKSGDTP
ncbi:MCE family protein [Pseudohalioglobus sediminis]|uniref:MCE family protein n=1 Tax=Pseudohalioglobus sediminis TaxID=2606449 RepID=A0A5B0X284_9GAMM|nr:MlaD family protein [Pseudohalioglobus sediminis]KAA1192815.1 MCE family protein [Pseudohalioglobus sediminis]